MFITTSLGGRPADGLDWVAPDACTLPTAEQPLRVADANAGARS